MNTLSILNQNVKNDIENRTALKVNFLKEKIIDFLSIYNQENKYLVLWGKTKLLTDDIYNELIGLINDSENVDGIIHQVINTDISYDEFYERFFNHLQSVN